MRYTIVRGLRIGRDQSYSISFQCCEGSTSGNYPHSVSRLFDQSREHRSVPNIRKTKKWVFRGIEISTAQLQPPFMYMISISLAATYVARSRLYIIIIDTACSPFSFQYRLSVSALQALEVRWWLVWKHAPGLLNYNQVCDMWHRFTSALTNGSWETGLDWLVCKEPGSEAVSLRSYIKPVLLLPSILYPSRDTCRTKCTARL